MLAIWGASMDLHPVENQPNLSVAAPAATQDAPPVAQYRDSSSITPSALPQYNPRQGRGFFYIDKLSSGMWRCVVKSAQGRVISWRDFGYTAEDYLRAWEWGHEWVGS